MGYCYDMQGRLACDACGNAGSVRKRTCPYKVHYAEGGSLPFCQPPALCPACNQRHKNELHARCQEGAAQANERERQRKWHLDAGHYERSTAWGDWHENVPAGCVGVRFVSKCGESYKLLPAASYAAHDWLHEYAEARDWDNPPEKITKSVTASCLVPTSC